MKPNALTLPTPRGQARVAVERAIVRTNGTALLFHGAGGGMDAPVLLAVRDALLAGGWDVARLDQPYRVAGRRAPDPAHHLDEVALLVVEAVRGDGPLLLGGKSSGARVACRIARAAGAVGVVALGFPLHPPGRPERSRAAELAGAGVPVLVLQGTRDAFGSPDDVRAAVGRRRGLTIRAIAGGDHSYAARRADGRTTAACVAEAATLAAAWAARRLPPPTGE
jgi:predicted alpha/beta-hydrolase family hydrolase